ncbi:MAG: 6-phosphofructokinase [Candidatus Spyradenecus sp.]
MTGNMLIAQSGGPSMVINQSLVGAVLAAKASNKIVEIYGALHGIQGIFDEDFIDLRAEPEEVLLKVAQTPSSALGSVRRKPTSDDCRALFAVLAKRNIRYFFYIGGNDSAETANIIAQEAEAQGYDLRCFHIPKTIDNDLLCNDHTPGYGSAARFVACAVRGDDLDNRALGGVKIDVIMGRNAGFLTAAAALARQDPDDGPHLIYVPERPFTLERFVSDVGECLAKYKRCVVAVSEGIRGEDGRAIAESFSNEVDAHGNVQLTSGALGENLAAVIREKLKVKRVRADTFGFIQRCFVGVASEVDAREARLVGSAAVQAAVGGKHRSGTITMTRLPGASYQIDYSVAPLSAVAKHTRELPDCYINADGNNVTGLFLDYARQIVGPLPVTARFNQLRGRR